VKLANIVPIDFLHLTLADEYHLFIADEVVANQDTFEAHLMTLRELHTQPTIILDSAAFETTRGTSIELMQHAAEIIQPTFLILPDRRDASASMNISLAAAAVTQLDQQSCKFMAVPHGRTWEEFYNSAKLYASWPRVTALGIVEETGEIYGLERSEVIKRLDHLPVQFHLLGVTENLEEFHDPYLRARCMGVDSGKMFCWGLEGVSPRINRVPVQYSGRPKGFFEISQTDRRCDAYVIDRLITTFDYWRNELSLRANLNFHTMDVSTVEPTTAGSSARGRFQEILLNAIALEEMRTKEYDGTGLGFGPLRWKVSDSLPLYLSALYRLADKWHRMETVFQQAVSNGTYRIDGDIAELIVDLINYAAIVQVLYEEENGSRRL